MAIFPVVAATDLFALSRLQPSVWGTRAVESKLDALKVAGSRLKYKLTSPFVGEIVAHPGHFKQLL